MKPFAIVVSVKVLAKAGYLLQYLVPMPKVFVILKLQIKVDK